MGSVAVERFAMSTVVVGGGISGLIFCFYNPRAILVRNSNNHLGNPFVFIQKNSYTEKLLKDLECSCPVVSVKVKNSILQSKITSGKMNSPIDREYIGTDIIANVGKNDILTAYGIGEHELCKLIESKLTNRIIDDRVVLILPEQILLEKSKAVNYSKLISTIHFKQFQKLCQSWEPGPGIKTADFYYRIDRLTSGFGNCIEYLCPDEENEGAIKRVDNKIIGSIGFEYKNCTKNTIVLKDGRVFGYINPAPENVIFSGRFATANPHWRIEDSIFLADKGLLFAEMFEEQKRYDFLLKSKLQIAKDERVHRLILHLHSELSELLREINWKMNLRSKKTPQATSILEEIVDVTKLTMAISLEYNYTPREIYEKFWTKSEINWKRLINEFYGGV